MRDGRSSHQITLLYDGKVLATGGMMNKEDCSQNAELYDPSTGVWKITGRMNQPRCSHTTTLLPNGKVLVTGGTQDDNFDLPSSELYA